ncbi:MAG: hypothetical protein J6P72_09465 [Firmicutes bacterium]|nr:hypothetical protein [Bacillota bacterium]
MRIPDTRKGRQSTPHKERPLIRRFLVFVLLAGMLAGLIPNMAADAAEGEQNIVQEFGTTPLQTPVTAPLNASTVSEGVSANCYILEVSTGTTQGGTPIENILYFAVHYTAGGSKHTEIIMPQEDAVQRGFEIAYNVGNRSSRANMVKDLFGLNVNENDPAALGSVQTDQFLFTTTEPITSIDKIQIFGRTTNTPTYSADGIRVISRITGTRSTWSCQGMRVLQVDKLYGLDYYGFISNKRFIDFSGKVIAEAAMLSGAGNFIWENSGGQYNIVPLGGDNGTAGVDLVNSSNKSTYEGRYNTTTHVDQERPSQGDKPLVIRLDLADDGGAGMEAFAASYEAGSQTKISDLKFCEGGAFQIRYMDVYGDQRDIAVPMVSSALGYIVETLGDVSIAGYAQQGDTLAIPVVLPDFASIVSIQGVFGLSSAVKQTGLSFGTTDTLRASRAALSDNDDISYTCLAIYKDCNLQATVNGATIEYDFQPGAGNPVQYDTTTSISGTPFSHGVLQPFSLQSYREDMVLTPVDRQERYLVTITTDSVENAGTVDDIKLQFRYLNMKDKEVDSPEYNVRQYVDAFYGEWPGNVSSQFAYQYGFSQGNTVQFMIPLSNVKKFTDVSFKLEGNDEWQVKGLSVAMVKKDTQQQKNGYEHRVASWVEINSLEKDPSTGTSRFMSHLRFTRKVDTYDVCFRFGEVQYPAGATVPGSSGGSISDGTIEPTGNVGADGNLIQDDGFWKRIDGEGSTINARDDIDWENLLKSMTYEDTKRNFGFAKERYRYKVTVKVAGNKVNPEDDDCGSANLFYFQLIFEKGSSGMTLANQQIVGDAFRTGTETDFYIPMAQDYGELQSIVVLPDATDTNSNIYDKMKIEYITVQQETTAARVPTWTARGTEEDGLGWVGIEYTEQGETVNTNEDSGHTLSELATSYNINESSYSVKLLFSITTGPYPNSQIYGQSPQLVGGMSMSFDYIDSKGAAQKKTGIDIVAAMNEYAGRKGLNTGTYTREVETDQGTIRSEVGYAISDPGYHFRAGKTDNFIYTVNDIQSIVDMSLQIRSDVVTKWNITNVSVYLINGNGTRILNDKGEYDYRYPSDKTPILKASWTRNESLTTTIPIFRDRQMDSIVEIKNIIFEDNQIMTAGDDYERTAAISREPKSKNDIVNVFIYPSTASTSTNPASYDLSGAVQYIDGTNKRTMQVSTGRMAMAYDESGAPFFYALGVGASNMESFLGVQVESANAERITAPMLYGIVQRIRNGVLIESYRLNGIVNAENGGLMSPTNDNQAKDTYRLLIQASPDTVAAELLPGERDLAVALYFTSLSGQELRSKYVYLTDMGYADVVPGQMLELAFDLGDIVDLTGIEVVSVGQLNMSCENAYVARQESDGSISGEWSLEGGFNPGPIATRYQFLGLVKYLKVDLETAEDEASISSGTTDPIRMTVGYRDRFNALQRKRYNNIRTYAFGDGFTAEGTDTVELLVPGAVEIRYIELEPYITSTGSSSQSAQQQTGAQGTIDPTVVTTSWKLHKLTAKQGLDGVEVKRVLDKRIFQNAPEQVFLADILVSGSISTYRYQSTTPTSATKVEIHNGEETTITIDSGSRAVIELGITDSTDGFDLKLRELNQSTGTESETTLPQTYKWDREYLTELYNMAVSSEQNSDASEQERNTAAALRTRLDQMVNGTGRFTFTGKEVTFQPPRNFTGSDMAYTIQVASKENASSSFKVTVIVKSEEDQVQSLLDAWNQVRTIGVVTRTISETESELLGTVAMYGTKQLTVNPGDSINVIADIPSNQKVDTVLMNGPNSYVYQLLTEHPYRQNPSYLINQASTASQILNQPDATDAEKTAAQAVIDLVNLYSKDGSYAQSSTGINIVVPGNYTGQAQSYTVNVLDASTRNVLFTVVLNVPSSEDQLPTAVSAMEAAKAAGDAYRASQSQQQNQQSQQNQQNQQDQQNQQGQ